MAVIDPLGRRTSTIYDAADRPVASSDAAGIRMSTVYDAANQPVGRIQPTGVRNTTTYDAAGRALTDVGPAGLVSTAVYDAASRLIAGISATGAVSTTVYDAAGRVTGQINALGCRITSAYDLAGRALASVDPVGSRSSMVYDAAGVSIASMAPDGGTTTIVYDAAQRPIASIDPLGYRSTTVYDAANRPISAIDALGYRSTRVYDATGQQIGAVDALGYVSTTVFDAAGHAVVDIDALGNRTSSVYDGSGAMVQRLDALGYCSTVVFDSAGRIICRIDAVGGLQTTIYDGFGRAAANMDSRGRISSVVHDAVGRAVGFWDPLGYRTTRTFDSFGRTVGSIDALGYQTTMVFDLLDRPAVQIDALGYATTNLYDAAGRAYASIDPMGRRASTVFDAASRTAAQINPLGYATTSSYDQRGSLVGVMNARGYRTTAMFDALARPLSNIDAAGRRTTLTYDARGATVKQTDAKGQVETRTYDALARCTATQYGDGTRTTTVFDALSRMTQISNQHGFWTWTYDGLHRRITEGAPGQPNGQPLTSVYDLSGNRTVLITWRGRQTCTYDARNQMTLLQDIEGGRTTWSYDARRMVSRQQNPNGTSTDTTYDGEGRPLTIRHKHPDGTWLDSALYTYDRVGNPSVLDREFGGATNYSYDALNQLLSQSSEAHGTRTWTYDPAGNRISEQSTPGGGETQISYWITCTYDAADQQLDEQKTGSVINSSSTSNFNYDPNGNRILETKVAGFVTSFATYTWDPSNRLSVLQDRGTVLTNTYRPDGLRHKKLSGSTTQQMVWDGNDLLAWVDNTGALGQFLTRGVRTVKTHTSPSQELFYHCDALGTMQSYSLPSGATDFSPILDAWGGQLPGIDMCTYVGDQGYCEESSGLSRTYYYVRARWLVGGGPGWLSADPASSNLFQRYLYVQNFPTRYADPSGLVRQVILGFDDSPRSGLGDHPESTEGIRDYLTNTLHTAGAFFVIGQRFDSRPHAAHPWNHDRPNPMNSPEPALCRLMALIGDGHLIGNHTYCHEHSRWPPNPLDKPDPRAIHCSDPAVCGPVWQIEVCRNHQLVRERLHYGMDAYRTPGLDWSFSVAGKVAAVLTPYVYRADNNSLDANVRRTVRTLDDGADSAKDWPALRNQVAAFLNAAAANDMLWLFMHDQPSSSADDRPRGLALLMKVVEYLKSRSDVRIINAPHPQLGTKDRCDPQLVLLYGNPGYAKCFDDCPSVV